MPEAGPIQDRTGAIAGIEILHEVEPGIQLGALPTVWPHGVATDDPVVIRHGIGDVSVDGMRLIMNVGMRVSYYSPRSGGVAIHIRNLDRSGPTHLVQIAQPGRRYSVTYEFKPRLPAYRRDVEITAFSHALTVRGNRLMAHGCGMVLGDGRGAICLGKSGAGKSTASRMLDGRKGARVLNDDRLVVERTPGAFHLWATPWPGTEGVARAGDAALGVIALIGQDRIRSTRKLTQREALSRLLPTLALPIWDPALMGVSLEFVGALLQQVPVIEMKYPLDDRTPDWLVDTLMETE